MSTLHDPHSIQGHKTDTTYYRKCLVSNGMLSLRSIGAECWRQALMYTYATTFQHYAKRSTNNKPECSQNMMPHTVFNYNKIMILKIV